jgi:hypothetical protein
MADGKRAKQMQLLFVARWARRSEQCGLTRGEDTSKASSSVRSLQFIRTHLELCVCCRLRNSLHNSFEPASSKSAITKEMSVHSSFSAGQYYSQYRLFRAELCTLESTQPTRLQLR